MSQPAPPSPPHGNSPRRRAADTIAIAGVVTYTAAIVVLLLANRVAVTADDGYYYFTIARNLAAGRGFTFDGVSATTGFQPLWLFVLLPVFRLFGEPHAALAAAIAVQAVLWAAAAAAIYALARQLFDRWCSLLVCGVWVSLTSRVALSGLEFSLQSFLLAVAAYLYVSRFARHRRPPVAAHLALGTLCGILMLARLDAALLALVLAAFRLAAERREPKRDVALRWAAFAAPVALCTAAYAALMLHISGHLLPISAVVKRDWSRRLLALDADAISGGWLMAKAHHLTVPLRGFTSDWYYESLVLGVFGALLVTLAAVIAGHRPSGRRLRQVLAPLAPFIAYGALDFLVFALFLHRGLSYSAWYYAVQPVVAGIVVAAVTDVARRSLAGSSPTAARRRSAALVPVVAIVLVLMHTAAGLGTWIAQEHSNPARHVYLDAAAWIAANLPADAVVGAWNAGTVGYWSGRRVVNLDGVVNDWAFFRQGRHDLCGYWQSAGVTYLVDVFDGDEALSAVPTLPAYRACRDRLDPVGRDDRYATTWSLRAFRIARERKEVALVIRR